MQGTIMYCYRLNGAYYESRQDFTPADRLEPIFFSTELPMDLIVRKWARALVKREFKKKNLDSKSLKIKSISFEFIVAEEQEIS